MKHNDKLIQVLGKPLQIPSIPQYQQNNDLQIESLSQLSLNSNPFQLSVSPFKEDNSKQSNPASMQFSNNSIQTLQISKSQSNFIENILSESQQANHIETIRSDNLIISSNSIVFKKKSPRNSFSTICNYYEHSNDVTPKIVNSHSDSHNMSLASDNILSSRKNYLIDKKTPIKYTKSQLQNGEGTHKDSIPHGNQKESTMSQKETMMVNINDTSLIKGKKNLKDTFEKMSKDEHSRQITEIYTKGLNEFFLGNTNDYQIIRDGTRMIMTSDKIQKKDCSTTIKSKSTRNNSSNSSMNKVSDKKKSSSKKTGVNDKTKNISRTLLYMNNLNLNSHLHNKNDDNGNSLKDNNYNHTIDTSRIRENQPKKNYYHLKPLSLTNKTARPLSQNNTSRLKKESLHELQDKTTTNNNSKGVISSKEKKFKPKIKSEAIAHAQNNPQINQEKVTAPVNKHKVHLNTKINYQKPTIGLKKTKDKEMKSIPNKTTINITHSKTHRNNHNELKQLPSYSYSNRSNSFRLNHKDTSITDKDINKEKDKDKSNKQLPPQTILPYKNITHNNKAKSKDNNSILPKKENLSQLLVKFYHSEMKKVNLSLTNKTINPSNPINISNIKQTTNPPEPQAQSHSKSILEPSKNVPKIIQNFSNYQSLKQTKDTHKNKQNNPQILSSNSLIAIAMPNHLNVKPPVVFTKMNQVTGDSDSDLILETE